jgi:hypothetical protein
LIHRTEREESHAEENHALVGLGHAPLVAVLLVGAPRAAAAPIFGTATGTFVITSAQQTPIGRHGGDTYYYQTFTLVYSGDLTGTTTNSDVYIVHSDGSATTQLGSESCAQCTLAGRTGGFTAVWNFIGSATQGSTTLIFTRGLGALHGLVGGGSVPQTGVTSGGLPSGTYSFTYELP